MGELDGRMKVGGKGDEFFKVLKGKRGGTDAVVNVSFVQCRGGSIVLLEYRFLQPSHEEAGVVGSHLSAHGYSADLVEVVVME